MEYQILSTQGKNGIEALEIAVNGYMADGWQPTGGVCAAMHQGSGVVTYYQSMVRYDGVEIALNDPEAAAPEIAYDIPDLSEIATIGAIEFAAETLGEDHESILLDLYTHLGRRVGKADVREIVPEVSHAD